MALREQGWLWTEELIEEFCFENGNIDWVKLVEFNSSKERPKAIRKK